MSPSERTMAPERRRNVRSRRTTIGVRRNEKSTASATGTTTGRARWSTAMMMIEPMRMREFDCRRSETRLSGTSGSGCGRGGSRRIDSVLSN